LLQPTYYRGGRKGYLDYLPIQMKMQLPLMEDNEVDKVNPSIVVTGYIKIAPKDREVFVKVLRAHVLRAFAGRPTLRWIDLPVGP
jgi:hypothetical protein